MVLDPTRPEPRPPPRKTTGLAPGLPDRSLEPATLHVGLDTLKVAFRVELRRETVLRLAKAREKASAVGGPALQHLGHGQIFAVHPTGANGLEFRLSNADCTILLGDDAHGWTVVVEFRSTWLTRNGFHAFAVARSLAQMFGPVSAERIRRVDLCADAHRVDFEVGDLPSFVSRARDRAAYETHSQLSGFTWGRGDIMARLYRKDKELREGNNDEKRELMHHAWSARGWDGATPVWRLELQLRFKALESLDATTGEQLRERIQALWSYGFSPTANDNDGSWLRLVDKSTASRRERAQMDARWSAYDGAVWGTRTVWTVRRSGKRGGAKLEQVRGCLLSWAASSGLLRPHETAAELEQQMAELIARFAAEITADGLIGERKEGARARFASLDDWSAFERRAAA